MKILAAALLLFPFTLIAQNKVGINTTNPVHPFQVNVDSTFSNFIPDQEHIIMDGQLAINPGSEMVTQGITIGQSGKLAKIQITLGVADVDEMLVELYLGPGPLGGLLGAATVFDVSGPGTYEVEFDQPWPDVTAGQQLNFLISPVTGTSLNISRSLGNTYPGGQAHFWNGSWSPLSYDLTFRTYVAQPDTASIDVLSVQQDGRVRVKNYVLPESDGTEGQVMATDGAGMLMWSNPDTSSSQSEILDDDGDTRIKVEAAPDEDIIRFSTAGSEKMNILSNGNVGIGTSGPLAKLHVRHNSTTSSSQLRLTETSATDFARIKFDNENDPGIFWDVAALADSSASVSKINFYYASPGFTGDKMTITGEGNVGIGTTAPGNRLRVNGSASSSQHILSAGVNYNGDVNIRAIEGFSTPATGYGIGGYFFGGSRGIQSYGYGGAATGLTIAVEGTATGTAGTRTGLFGRATGGTTNWAGYFADGNVMTENNLFINGSVGIGTTSPGNKLRVNGSTTSPQHVFSAGTNYSGNVHIRAVEGFSTPATGYGIGGYFIGGAKGIEAQGNGGSFSGTVNGVEGYATGTAGTRIGIYGWASGGATNWAARFGTGNVWIENNVRIDGNVGIGTSTPATALDVNGKMKIANDGDAAQAGMIRWNSTTSDFEGYDGTQWLSLTAKGVSGGWGNPDREVIENSQGFASDGAAGDELGSMVGISGNYAIVGAPFHNTSGNTDRGKAYIFYYNGTSWSQQAILTASDGVANDFFGWRVATDGNYAVVGVSNQTVGGIAQGKAYVFVRNGTTWSQQAILSASDGAADDAFGSSVSIDNDFILVGAKGCDYGGHTNIGKAYIFDRNGTSWTQVATLTPPDGASGDSFGSTVSISGTSALVGAPNHDTNGHPNRGKAYVYVWNVTSWPHQATLISDDGWTADAFSESVALSGDYAVIGAPGHDSQGYDVKGQAYVYMRSGSTWSQTTKMTAPDGNALHFFGESVSILDDQLIVGAHQPNIGSPIGPGKAYLFTRTGSNWNYTAGLSAADGQNDDQFGASVAISTNHTIVGAPEHDASGQDKRGKIYFFRKQ